jgi:malic enzyme
MLDSNGLTFDGRDPLDPDKRELALNADELRFHGFDEVGPQARYDLEAVVQRVKPTILIGTSGTPGTFTEGAIREMARHARIPIVLPLSNPTSKTEALPVDVLDWTQGRAVVATGSPFAPVSYHGREHLIGQANNAFIFPGVGLGAIVSRARRITDEMFLAAAETLASRLDPDRLAHGALYPSMADLRSASRSIAIRVVQVARDAGLGLELADEEIEAAVDAMIWEPEYSTRVYPNK